MNNKIMAKELVKIARQIISSTPRFCEIYKANNGNWYLGLADREHGGEDEARYYGPFSSEERAQDKLDYFSNPGGYYTDSSGKRPPPKFRGSNKNVNAVSHPTVTATVLARELVENLDDAYETLRVAGDKYYELKEEIGSLDSRLLKVIRSAVPEDKEEVVKIILDGLSQNHVSIVDTISSQLYEELKKVGDVNYSAKKSKYSIIME